MRFLCKFTAALGVALATPVVAAAQGGTTEFIVFSGGRQIGIEQVTIGTSLGMACPGAENLGFSPTTAGTYRFKYTKADGTLLVTGP